MKFKQIILAVFGLITTVSGLFFTALPANAQVVFTDDFSNGFEKWQDVRDNFNVWSLINQSADAFVRTPSTLSELIPKDEFWNPEWKNYTYQLDYTYLEGADNNVSFWFQDIYNWYQIHFISGRYILSHIENGIAVWGVVGDLNLESNIQHHMEIHLQDGQIKFFMDGNFIFEHFDPTFNNDFGRIGLKAATGSIFPTHVQFDNISVSLISTDFILPMNVIKQIDPLWKNIEYDSATKWAKDNFGIGDWGCLLTSINMILKYYDINAFPDGSEITPVTLNDWLNLQVDGYIGPGLVNWSAISRLVKEIQFESGGVNLEYSRIAGEGLQDAINFVEKNQPVILEIPGHFFVGNGFNQLKNDLYITDPAYAYTKLSQHQLPLKSTRLLTPSHTDLSYIQMAHENNISVSLTNEDGLVPENYQTYSEHISNPTSSVHSPEYILHEFSKPQSGNYKISVTSTNSNPQEFELIIFAYDTDGNLNNLTYSGVAGSTSNPTLLNINFNKDAESTIASQSNFTNLTTDIQDLLNSGEISKHYVAFELKLLTEFASESNPGNIDRYIGAINSTMQWYANYLSESARDIISKRLLEISQN